MSEEVTPVNTISNSNNTLAWHVETVQQCKKFSTHQQFHLPSG